MIRRRNTDFHGRLFEEEMTIRRARELGRNIAINMVGGIVGQRLNLL